MQCPCCGFCGSLSRPPFGAAASIATDEYKAILQDPDLPELARTFRAAATIVGMTDPYGAGRNHLASAWVCDDHHRERKAVQCRRLAIDSFLQCEPCEECKPDLDPGELYNMPLLLIDMLRRTGDFEKASNHAVTFRRLASEEDAVLSIIDCQQSLIAARDVRAHTIPDRPLSERELRKEEERRRAAQERREAWNQECAVKLKRDSVTELKLTARRCSDCGKPCPTYRVTCKYCGVKMGRVLT